MSETRAATGVELLPEHIWAHEDLPEAAWEKREEIWRGEHGVFEMKRLVDEFADILRAEANDRLRAARQRIAELERAAPESDWRKFAMRCASYLNREQIKAAARDAGVVATFCEPPTPAAPSGA